MSWRLLFGLATVGLLWFALRQVSLREVWTILSHLALHQLLLLWGVNGLILWALGGRWHLFLIAQGHHLPYGQVTRYRLAAFGVSYFTPGPHFGGEPLQVYLLQQRHRVPTADAIAAVTLDKTFDLLFNFIFLCAGFLLVLERLPTLRFNAQAVPYVLLLAMLPGGLLVALRLGWRPISALIHYFVRYAPWVKNVYEVAHASESQMIWLCQQKPLILWVASLLSLGNWALLIGEFWLATYVLDLQLSLLQAVFVMVATRVAILLPMPAGLGALEASLVLATGMLGLDPATGISLSILIRTRDVLVGLLGLWLASVDVQK